MYAQIHITHVVSSEVRLILCHVDSLQCAYLVNYVAELRLHVFFSETF